MNWVADMSDAAVEPRARHDVAVVCVGNHPEGNAGWEVVTRRARARRRSTARRSRCRPAGGSSAASTRRTRSTVVVLVSSFPVAVPWAAANATTILHITHASQELGNALADVLFGDFNPAAASSRPGRASLDELPPMMDYDIRHGRTYMYFAGEPQYPFGYGLSYTTFAYFESHDERADAQPGGRSTSAST